MAQECTPEGTSRQMKFLTALHEKGHCFKSLGPIADIPVIISTICFRHHNLCKK